LRLDFPSRPGETCRVTDELTAALGRTPVELLGSRDFMAVYDSEEAVRALAPDLPKIAALERFAVIVTAPGKDCDFVSRFFAPAEGVPEDPVCGSAHCTLIPYWAKRLGKSLLFARQVSPRGGELHCEDRGDRVAIAGRAVLYLEGTIFI
jgi:predicted PhzF superfamily epimerase YddE/YHI9